jgi:hypothetical protein
MAAAFSLGGAIVVVTTSSKRHCSASQLMQQYYGGEEENNYYSNDDQSQYYDNQQQSQYYDDEQQQQQQNQQYYDEQQQQYYNDDQSTNEEPTLLITNNMQQEMQRATSNIEMGGLDYLALARQRAAARVESINNQSTEEDWKRLAEEKRIQSGGYVSGDEAWEASLGEEGSESDFAASLGMSGVNLVQGEGGIMMTEGGLVVDNMDDGDEPQLLF